MSITVLTAIQGEGCSVLPGFDLHTNVYLVSRNTRVGKMHTEFWYDLNCYVHTCTLSSSSCAFTFPQCDRQGHAFWRMSWTHASTCPHLWVSIVQLVTSVDGEFDGGIWCCYVGRYKRCVYSFKKVRKNAKNTGDRYGLKIIQKVEIPE